MEWDSIEPGKRQGVYAIFVKGTDNCLYVGESGNLRSRINGHFYNSKTSDLRCMVKEDMDPPVDEDELRYVTEVRIMHMPGSDAKHRRTVEKKLTEELNPRYPVKGRS